MSVAPRKAKNDRRIQPVNLRDLPTVLDVNQAANVLRMSPERVREFANSGELHRLTYSRVFLFSAIEVARFLEQQTKSLPKEQAS